MLITRSLNHQITNYQITRSPITNITKYYRTRLVLKRLFDRIRNEKIKFNLLQAIPFWIASLITGLIAVLYAWLFALAEKTFQSILSIHYWWIFILTPICFVLSWWIVVRFSPYAKGSGIPQVMAAIDLANPKTNEKVDKLLNLKVVIVKVASSLIFAFGGGIIGREGPTIQVAGSIFRKINGLLPKWWPKISKRNMIMTGASAGLAAAFNTPLGGIMFAVEELTKTHISLFKTAIFSAVIIAGLTAQAILGPYLYLGYPNVNDLSIYIFFGVVLVAVVSGLMGSGMSKLMLVILKWRAGLTFKYRNLLYVTGCAVVIATLAFFVDHSMLGSGRGYMTNMLFTSEKHSHWYTPLCRILGNILSFTTGAAGGVFAPALSAGASIGSVISGWFNLSDTNSNLLILSGMVGFLTGVTRTPFTSAILVLEMTDRHNVIFHLMVAGMIASIVSRIIDKHSLYDHLKVQYIRDIGDGYEKEDTTPQSRDEEKHG